jgi:hypothetical protein
MTSLLLLKGHQANFAGSTFGKMLDGCWRVIWDWSQNL